jgi:hypothetical protein
MLATAVVGVVVIVALAVLVGVLDQRWQRIGWARIAERRRELSDVVRELAEREEQLGEYERDLQERELLLAHRIELGSCPACAGAVTTGDERVA